MPLDVGMLLDDDTIESAIPVGVGVHARLIGLAQNVSVPLTMRMADYYSDAEIACAELSDWDREIQILIDGVPSADAELLALLRELGDLCLRARTKGLSVVAVAD